MGGFVVDPTDIDHNKDFSVISKFSNHTTDGNMRINKVWVDGREVPVLVAMRTM